MDKDKFINDIVFEWIKLDLMHMKNDIPPRKYEQGNIHFPLVLYTLSCMDFLGAFLHDRPLGPGTSSIGDYIGGCGFDAEEYNANLLKQLYRNNLAHNYFPYGSITRNGYSRLFYKGPHYDINLDAEKLVNDFLESLATFATKLTNDRYEKRMTEYKSIRENFLEDHKDFIDSLEKYPNDEELHGPSLAAPEDESSYTRTGESTSNSTNTSVDKNSISGPPIGAGDSGVDGNYMPKSGPSGAKGPLNITN
ncbi:hypothetical protein A3K01_00245 [candidate division WWE3 bacterium RIFOXYD1_FULL_43_17]|uniref:Uncharacterized protein n=3 Tax=Katanobacteria TaxID=422282 RepID=A0A1F4XC14_UNCKA|nr:MAG: hypothetical protein UU59_C0005G0021 [candidate division WWE3 bacterium GW2011_GWE1_41_27]KKS60688.1 MAG: hypothetical protein UV26_C0002G0014 [candidate division WWE3 bacterium GW2011_GWF2_42_42]OGC79216.1 MAG: hypothetical protein A3K01_00245 [candidate division WWE3 bacterium RIFOXYD1_FULL_43_17]